jgi:hypothetical protein
MRFKKNKEFITYASGKIKERSSSILIESSFTKIEDRGPLKLSIEEFAAFELEKLLASITQTM